MPFEGRGLAVIREIFVLEKPYVLEVGDIAFFVGCGHLNPGLLSGQFLQVGREHVHAGRGAFYGSMSYVKERSVAFSHVTKQITYLHGYKCDRPWQASQGIRQRDVLPFRKYDRFQ
jgi:hypothetical protein